MEDVARYLAIPTLSMWLVIVKRNDGEEVLRCQPAQVRERYTRVVRLDTLGKNVLEKLQIKNLLFVWRPLIQKHKIIAQQTLQNLAEVVCNIALCRQTGVASIPQLSSHVHQLHFIAAV